LNEESFKTILINSDQSQAERIRVMNQMRRDKVKIVISTDLLSRGIDIQEIDLIINFDFPREIETYYHRIGRTGRYGKYGVSVIFVTKDDDFINDHFPLLPEI
jgi:superfamily II DNA/RNA helicase